MRLILFFGFPVYRLWFLTIRKRYPGIRLEMPAVIGFWHCDIFMAIGCIPFMTEPEKTAALVSPSRDGDYLTLFLKRLRYHVIRGSSSSGSVPGLWESLRQLRSGISLMITPDGPKGPHQSIKPGIIELSRMSGCPVRLMHFRYSHCWRLKSWDRFVIPKPFSECIITVSPPVYAQNFADENSQNRILQTMEDLLHGRCPDPIMEKQKP